MQIKQLYIKAELDGSITLSLEKEDDSWVLSDTVRIFAEPNHILFHNGVCYGADVADTDNVEGWTEVFYMNDM